MATLYYGNGNCTISGLNIRGVEIRFTGAIKIVDKTSKSFAIAQQNNGIMIFPIGWGTLNDLFDYKGKFIINSVIVSDENGEQIPCSIRRVMEYSELLRSKSEDLTIKSENLSTGYVSKNTIARTVLENPIIPDLHTSYRDGSLYLSNGSEYNGEYHIHLSDGNNMTGSSHTKSSENLYPKNPLKRAIQNKMKFPKTLRDKKGRKRKLKMRDLWATKK